MRRVVGMSPPDRIVSKPILPVAQMAAAIAFYRRLGFEVRSYDRSYAWVVHSGVELFHLRLVEGLSSSPAAVYLHLREVAPWHSTWTDSGIDVAEVEDQPWGMREFTMADPSGNLLRVGQNI